MRISSSSLAAGLLFVAGSSVAASGSLQTLLERFSSKSPLVTLSLDKVGAAIPALPASNRPAVNAMLGELLHSPSQSLSLTNIDSQVHPPLFVKRPKQISRSE